MSTEALRARPDASPRDSVEERADPATPPLTRAGLLAVSAAAAGWTVAVAALAVWRHDQFLSHRYDLGNMVQAVWSSAHGRLLEVTDGATGEQVVRLAAHVDPILLLFVPFWLIHPAPETLIVVQAAALASGLYPVVQLARRYVGSRVAVSLLGAWYMVFPWVVWNALNDVHPVTLAIPLLLWAIWFLDSHRLGAFAIAAVLALATGELVGLTVAMLGVWYAVRYRRVRVGVGIAALATTWTAFCMAVVIPAFNDGASNRFYGRFDDVGGSPVGVVRTLFTDPTAVLSAISSGADLKYLVLVLLPTAFLALGAPLLAAAALPQLGVNVLSGFWPTTQPLYQYVAPVVAPLVAATIVALSRFPVRVRSRVVTAPLAASVVLLLAVPPIPGSEHYVFARQDSPDRLAAMREAVDLIPSNAVVSSTNRLGAHLSARRRVLLFPRRASAQWVAIDTADPWLELSGERADERRFAIALRKFENDSSWERVFDREGIRVYRQRASD